MTPTPDFAAARDVMVDGQLRPTKIIHRGVLDAMRRLPREAFAPPGLQALAYIDDDLALPGGRFMLRPLSVARLVQLAEPQPGERALVIGAGSGYLSAVLAACGVAVTALEQDPALAALARANRAMMPGVVPAEGNLAAGLEAGAPYDLLVIEGAVAEIPARFARMLTPAGRLVGILAPRPGQSVAVRAVVQGGSFVVTPAMDCFAPMLPGFAPAPAFAL